MFPRIIGRRLSTRTSGLRGAAKSRERTLLTHTGVRRSYHPFRSFEPLEPRVVLSVFYDMTVMAAVGDTAPTGERIDSIDAFVSINDNGRVAFTANVSNTSGSGSALIVDDGPGAPISLNIPNADQAFAFPQINNAGLVTARDRFGTTVDSFVRTWNSDTPGQFTIVAGTNAAAGDVYDSVTLPTLADDGAMGFIGFTNGSAQSDLYYNQSGMRFNEEAVLNVTGTGGLRPMISNNGMLVVKRGSGASADIVVASSSGTFSVASSATGFTALGSAPSISDNGRLVAFAGDRGNGPGIFLAVLNAAGTGLDSLITVAGDTPAPAFSKELGYDAAGNPLFLASFELDNRIGLSRTEFGPPGLEGDSVVLTFVATPNAASRSNPQAGGRPLLFSDQTGLWTVQVDFQTELAGALLQPHVKSPIPVVQIGDTIAGQAVTGITLYDPIGIAATDDLGNARTPRFGEHRVAFVASTATTSMVVRASQLDSDEDGLYDHWERAGGGIDMDQDGTIDLDLSAMGASVFARDLFLEIDWLNSRRERGALRWSNEPPPGVPAAGGVPAVPSATQFVVNTFALAPALANGIPVGITVHLDAGAARDALGNPFSQNMGTGSLQGGDQIGQQGTGAHLDVVHFGLPGSIAVPGVQARAFSDIKDNFFGTTDKRARELAFRYVVLADFKDVLTDAAGNAIAGNVSVATATTITATAALPAVRYGGHAVLITAGTGAGQVRNIAAQPGASQLRVANAWTDIPDATSQFVILHGSSGQGETDWYADPDHYSVPGNDVVVSMGGFGVNMGILSNSFLTGRTIVHEVGHTLGLRHGGVDHNPFKMGNYLSLMSYSHQTNPASPVNSYSGAGDPTFDDWSNLKLGFQNTLVHVGNTFGLGLGDIGQAEPEPELTVAQVEELIGGPLDLEAPTQAILSPATNASVQLNDAFAVDIEANDPSGVGAVEVRFDVNGDGDTDDQGDRVLAAIGINGNYTTNFDSLSGQAGPRMLRVIAIDTLGNFRIDDRNLEVVADDDPNGPEIRVTGSGLPIVAGSGNPASANHTSFDSVVQNQPKPRRTYSVHNAGAAQLTLGAVALPAGFTVVEPLVSTLGVGQSDSFTVELDTSTVGVFTGEVSFSTNDVNENPFSFVISGTIQAPAPEIEVTGNNEIIVDGDTTSSALDHTDFGLGGAFQTGPTRVFTVRNIGTADLTLGPVTVPAGFALIEPLAANLLPGASDTFSVRLDTVAQGTFSGQISFTTSDANEDPFNFAIAGSVATLPGSLDLTFGGGDGKVAGPRGIAHSVVVQTDGKILLGGEGDNVSAAFALARYHPNGDVDTTFGDGDGLVGEVFPGASSGGRELLLLPDGKFMLVGYASTVSGIGVGMMRFNSDGSLDTTFDTDGKVIRLIGSISPFEGSAALQPDGKVIVVGLNFTNGNDFAVARLNANGTVDTSFGGGDGFVTTDFGSSDNDVALGVVIQPDGRIVVSGVANGSSFGLARYNADGTLDATFGGGEGLVITGLGHQGKDVALQADGRIVVVGTPFAVARYLSDGTPDPDFGDNGFFSADLAPSEAATSMAVEGDGKILVSGEVAPPVPGDRHFFLARLNSDGTLDTAFDGDGVVFTDFAGLNDFGSAVVLQADEKILVAGSSFATSEGLSFAVARFHSQITVLPTVTLTAADAEGSEIVGDGLRFTVARSGVADEPLTVTFRLQNDGGAGQAALGSDFTFGGGITSQIIIPAGADSVDIDVTPLADAVHEFDELITLEILADPAYAIGLPFIDDGVIHGECEEVVFNGELDPTFGGGDGSVSLDFGTGNLFGRALAVTPDGRIVVASIVGSNVAIARFRQNGIPDPSFHFDGLVVTPLDVHGNMRPTVAVQPDGKVIAAGTFLHQSNGDFGMARYNVDGSVDSTFGGGDGVVETDFAIGAFPFDDSYTILLQPDGKILLAGSASTGEERDLAIARYNPDGSLDTTFGGDGLVTTDTRPGEGDGDVILALALMPDGRIIATGSNLYNHQFFTGADWPVVRYLPDGSLDTTFGNGGIVITSVQDHNHAYSVAVQPDGKILVSGVAITQRQTGNSGDAVLARYNLDGSLDASFGAGSGVVVEQFDPASPSQINSIGDIELQPDGRVIVVGSGQSKLFVARYNPDGTRDPSFGGGDGVVAPDGLVMAYDAFDVAARQPDGRVVILHANNTLTRLTGDCLAAESNLPPVLDPIADAVASVGQVVTVTAAATDPDGDGLTFTLDVGAPAGATINAQTGEFSFTTTAGQSGQVFSITVRVTDDGQPALFDTDTFTITVVSEDNLPPALEPIADLVANVGQAVTFTTAATDPDGDGLTFTLDAGAPAGATINAQTGEFLFTPLAAQVGVFDLTVRVTDDGSPALTDTETFSITVQPQIEPQFTMSQINGPGVAVPGQLRSYSITFTDPNAVGNYTTAIDWGDGVTSSGVIRTQTSGGVTTGGVSFWHTYSAIGDRTIELTLRDGQGHQLTAQKFVTVQLVTFQPDPLNPARRALVAGGHDAVDLITFNPDGPGVNVMYRDYSHGRFTFDGSVIAYGQGGNDNIRVHASLANTAMLFGQDGDDLLVAGAGASVLVGGAGNDTLHGSSFRDLLFGGLGADLLFGIAPDRAGAMDDGDLIASDLTAWEYDPNLLASIFNRWQLPESYSDQLISLRFRQSTALNNTTVFDDFAADRLTGGAGLDWFVYFSNDLVADPQDGEHGLGVRL
jgi:uncharacterized delta-60 repeat protein